MSMTLSSRDKHASIASAMYLDLQIILLHIIVSIYDFTHIKNHSILLSLEEYTDLRNLYDI